MTINELRLLYNVVTIHFLYSIVVTIVYQYLVDYLAYTKKKGTELYSSLLHFALDQISRGTNLFDISIPKSKINSSKIKNYI